MINELVSSNNAYEGVNSILIVFLISLQLYNKTYQCLVFLFFDVVSWLATWPKKPLIVRSLFTWFLLLKAVSETNLSLVKDSVRLFKAR